MHSVLRSVAVFMGCACLAACGILWNRGYRLCEELMIPLLPGWSLRLDNYRGRQMIEILPFGKPRLVYVSYPTDYESMSDERMAFKTFVVAKRYGRYEFGFPSWFSFTIAFSATLTLLIPSRVFPSYRHTMQGLADRAA